MTGTILGIINDAGKIVAKYSYSAYGKCSINLNTNGIATINPFRFKCYYYDVESDMYYCQTRYFVPEWGRWLNVDHCAYLELDNINGMNLFAYCGNSPINCLDPNGTKWWGWLLGIGVIVATIALSIATAGLAAPLATALGGGITGTIVAGAATGAVGGAIAGFGVSVGVQGVSKGFDNIDFTEVAVDTLYGAGSGAIAGGIFGGLKYVAGANKIAGTLSGLSSAQQYYNNSLFALQNTPITILGGVMSTDRIAAQLSFNSASVALSNAKSIYSAINFSFTQIYRLAQFGFKQLINRSFKG